MRVRAFGQNESGEALLGQKPTYHAERFESLPRRARREERLARLRHFERARVVALKVSRELRAHGRQKRPVRLVERLAQPKEQRAHRLPVVA